LQVNHIKAALLSSLVRGIGVSFRFAGRHRASFPAGGYLPCFFVNRTLNIVLIAAMPAKKITSAELSPRETFPTRNRM